MSQHENILYDTELLEVTGHARGGQGMVTAFEILAKIFSRAGDWEVQAFPSFGVERTGAPIQGFLRISKNPILTRSNIYSPHLIVVFDESLIGQVPVFDGLREDGIILLNTSSKPELFQDKASIIYTVLATKISLDKKLGSKSLPIVNSAMIGALIRILDGDIEIAKEIIRDEVPTKPEENAEAAEIAFNNLSEHRSMTPFHAVHPNGTSPATEVPSIPSWNQPMSLNKTGSWRLSIPIYVTREAPCTAHCPAGTDVRGFIQLASGNLLEEAYDMLYRKNPFPSVCGRVCPGFCEQNCNREAHDGYLNISAIERYLGDKGLQRKITPQPLKFDEKIAVIGSGPAALTASLRLRQAGYVVTVYEALPVAGTTMRNSLSEFSLPENLLDEEINKIVEEGVEIMVNHKNSVNDIPGNFSAIIAARATPNKDDAVETPGQGEPNSSGVPVFYVVEMNNEKSVAGAVGAGNEAAREAHAFLRGKKYEPEKRNPDIVTSTELHFQYYDTVTRNPTLNYTLSDAVEGKGDKEIEAEAGRCLHCGSCFQCGNCYNYCPDSLVYFDNKKRIRIDYEYCKGCGICFHECPSAAMKFDIIKKVRQ